MMRKMSEVCKMFNLDRNYLMRLKKSGLLPPTAIDSSGLKTALYNEMAVERLWMIVLLHKELNIKLKDVGRILDDPNFDRYKCLEMQINLLKAKVERLNQVLNVAEAMRTTGLMPQDIVDTSTLSVDEYVNWFSKMMDSINPELMTNLENLFHDKDLNRAISAIIVLGKNGLAEDSEETQTEVKKVSDVFERYIGKGGTFGLKRFGEMLCTKSLFALKFDEAKGSGISKYIGKAIVNYCERGKNKGI